MPPVVCKFWQQGSCRYGDKCRFDHPPDRGIPSGNRYTPLQNLGPNSRNNGGHQSGASGARTVPYSLDKDAIITDLSSERPQWILSAYGPGRQAPAQLFGGPLREQSFEEMRLLHYAGLISGNPQQAVQEAEKLVQASEQQMQTALRDVDGAINFIIGAEKDHPNRIDICRDSQAGILGNSSTQSPFNQQSSPNPFQAAPASNNPFGAISQLPGPTGFGAPSAPVSTGAFGQPSALGQRSNPFGTPSQLGGAGAFGNPSALGVRPNPFGPPIGSSSAATAPFSSFAGAANPFAQRPQIAATPNHFEPHSVVSQATSFGEPSVTANPFALPNPPTPNNPFGTSSPAQEKPFGEPSAPQQNPFGAGPSSQLSSNPFGNHQPTPQNANPFGNTISTVPSSVSANPFGGASQPPPPAINGGSVQTPYAPNTHFQHPSLDMYSSKDHSGRLIMFKGKRVTYRQDEAGILSADGRWQKIWFPDGAPPFYKDTEMEDAIYDEDTKSAYTHLRQNGSFQGGSMPLLPPKREWCLWDF